ncbi:MAG: patatin-like phospholipase family protein, partial [Acidobacteria bacterium]|nr:patatin-like phospholipase family protein [Acidobacteriota bacterium]
MPQTPVVNHEEEGVQPGIGLALSGGGYRAMLFHAGSLWRLYDTGVLGRVDRISSVSGGSITAAVLGLAWNRLSFDPANLDADFRPLLVEPIRQLAGKTIDVGSILWGIMTPGKISDHVTAVYNDELFHHSSLQDLPDRPRFVINATNVQSGSLWRFSKPYMRDYRVGEVKNPSVEIADAVAASSAFPPFLSPKVLRLRSSDFTANSGDLQREPFTTRVVLSDGGVYDNLGLETIYKRYETLLVSNAGAKMKPDSEPGEDWIFHSKRVADIVDNQVRSLRIRQLVASYRAPAGDENHRKGAYW